MLQAEGTRDIPILIFCTTPFRRGKADPKSAQLSSSMGAVLAVKVNQELCFMLQAQRQNEAVILFTVYLLFTMLLHSALCKQTY